MRTRTSWGTALCLGPAGLHPWQSYQGSSVIFLPGQCVIIEQRNWSVWPVIRV